MTETNGKSLRVYSRAGCHLCEDLIEALLPLVRGYLEVQVVDIDTREDWRTAYNTRVPVVEFERKTISEYPLDVTAIRNILNGLPVDDLAS